MSLEYPAKEIKRPALSSGLRHEQLPRLNLQRPRDACLPWAVAPFSAALAIGGRLEPS